MNSNGLESDTPGLEDLVGGAPTVKSGPMTVEEFFAFTDTLPDDGKWELMFEILSPSTTQRDLRWKRAAYPTLLSLTHYVVIAQDAVDVVIFAREAGFEGSHLRSLSDWLELAKLGISLPLSEIYFDTGLK